MERKEEIWLIMIYNLVILVPRLMLICRIRAQGNSDIYLINNIAYIQDIIEIFLSIYSHFSIVNLVTRV